MPVLRIILIIVFTVAYFAAGAQEPGSSFYSDDIKNERYDAGAPFFSGALIPGYSPEMEFNFTGSLLLSFKTRRNNPYLSYSNFPAVISVTTRGDIFCTGLLTSFWFDDRFRFSLLTNYINRDDNYWGVGMDNAGSVSKGESTTAYHQEHFAVKPAFVLKIVNKLYAGILLNYVKTEATEINGLMLEDPAVNAYGTSISGTGLGVLVNYDTRDSKTLPVRGIMAGAEGLFYTDALSDYEYTVIELDYRQYTPAIREGSVLAWQVNARFGTSRIPWTDMPQLGSMNDLRGYYYGQYRDRSAGYLLVEYRHTFLRKSDLQLSRHGFVFWLGGGSAFDKISSIHSGIFSTGLGYRFQIQPQSNIRLDVGFGTEYVGIYLGFFEAF
jgi:outer membrane protein assembly factor BamA